jgi:hypothetical protein
MEGWNTSKSVLKLIEEDRKNDYPVVLTRIEFVGGLERCSVKTGRGGEGKRESADVLIDDVLKNNAQRKVLALHSYISVA